MLDESMAQPDTATNELTQYLDSDTVHIGPLAFWREHQTRFPAIAALARDILSFPATEEKEARYLERFFSHIEIQAAKEEKDEKLDEVQIDLISDTEEQEQEQDKEVNDEIGLDEVDGPQLPAPENSTQVRASGRKRKTREDEVFEYYSK
ncbi:hypothetical protein N7513_003450 [Penicillium frequentans]|nr:hypothetical protein N7513_003450 [Penicillium glabrum]